MSHSWPGSIRRRCFCSSCQNDPTGNSHRHSVNRSYFSWEYTYDFNWKSEFQFALRKIAYSISFKTSKYTKWYTRKTQFSGSVFHALAYVAVSVTLKTIEFKLLIGCRRVSTSQKVVFVASTCKKTGSNSMKSHGKCHTVVLVEKMPIFLLFAVTWTFWKML